MSGSLNTRGNSADPERVCRAYTPVIDETLTITINELSKSSDVTLYEPGPWNWGCAWWAAPLIDFTGSGNPPVNNIQTASLSVGSEYVLCVVPNDNGKTDYDISFGQTNQPPIANSDTALTNQDTAVEIDVTINDTDADGTIDLATVAITQAPANGGVSVNTVTGVVTYTPNSGYFGTDTFKYRVNDNDGVVSNEATVTVTVNQVLVTHPLADWHFDECVWDGSVDEVQDSSGNSYHGTSRGATIISNTGGGIYNNGEFLNSYVELPGFPHINSSRTITAWFKTTDKGLAGQRIFADDENNANGSYALSVGDPGSGRVRFFIRGLSAISLDSAAVVENNTWYFAAATFDKSSMKKTLYIYNTAGTLLSEVTQNVSGTVATPTGRASIGGETLSSSEPFKFKGQLDEVKVFIGAKSKASIKTIVDNERSGKNYDGSSRMAPCCCLPQNGNLIANPSFETLCNSNIITTWTGIEGGTVHLRDGLCGWNITKYIETWENTTNKPASDGIVFMEIDGDNTVDTIWQFLNTQDGDMYTIRFDYRKRDNAHGDNIIAKWNDVEILQVEGVTTTWQTATIYVAGTAANDKLSFEEPSSANDSYGSWIDNIRVVLGGPPPVVTPASHFDVWDTFRNIDDRNISTKLSGQNFNLALAALNKANDDYQDFNGTVCTQVVDTANANSVKSMWTKSYFLDNNLTTISLNVPTAVKNAQVNIVWKRDVDEACPLVGEDNRTFSSDDFAVRPNNFDIGLSSPIKAAQDFNVTFYANDISGNATGDYNEIVTSSLDVNVTELKPACKTALFNPDIKGGWQFTNGSKTLSTKYPDVGELSIIISENSKPCSLRFSGVDCEDKNITGWWNTDTNLSIESKQSILSILADHFNVGVVSHDFEDGAFTYLSKDLNMSAYADINITAQNRDNLRTENYNTDCYANSFAIDLNYTNVDNALVDFLYIYKNNDVNSSLNVAAVNTQVSLTSLPKTFFTTDINGSAAIRLYYNFDRNNSVPINPFDINITNLYVSDINDANGTGLDAGKARFYYGRLRGNDIVTTNSPAFNPLLFEVYDKLGSIYTETMKQTSLFWFINDLHTGDTPGNVVEATASSNTIIDNLFVGFTFSYAPVASGVETLGIDPATNKKAIIHLKTQEWLWYVPSGFGSAYDDTAGSDCTMHPCFNYTMTGTNGALMIQSGDFNGTAVPDQNRSDYQRKGVKLFR